MRLMQELRDCPLKFFRLTLPPRRHLLSQQPSCVHEKQALLQASVVCTVCVGGANLL